MSGSIIAAPNTVFAVVAYDEGKQVHAKVAWNPAYQRHLSIDDKERMFIALQAVIDEEKFKALRPRRRT